ncbi:glycosyltransferase family 2 protein [Clostridium sp.]|uniref:glycosyltransferase family 2 protein n=1 Tax=Clostridium sp. TaxID=1506 RepID=UPI003993C83E
MKKKIFSLIMATYGRRGEVESFLESILNRQNKNISLEVIIVDQNKKIDLKPIIDKYNDKIDIKHIKSDVIGLSKNRNIGIKESTGQIIAFPDDDCEYLPQTLDEVYNAFSKNSCDLVMGRIVERDGSDSLRHWSKEECLISKNNFYTKCSSVTLFLKKDKSEIMLNEKLGVGEYFGSCEDADLIYRNSKKGMKIKYVPSVQIYHPHYDSNNNMSLEKINSYGLGFGAMVKANFDFPMSILFMKAQGYHSIKMILNLLKLDFRKANNSYIALVSRFKGFFEYKGE